MNPIYGSVGLLWSGSWQLCQAAVEAVLKGAPITPITSEAATNGRGPPLKAYDIRHVSKDENSAASAGGEPNQRAKARPRFKRTVKPKPNNIKGPGSVLVNRSASHESSVSEEAVNESKESESMISVETAATSVLFRDEPESTGKRPAGDEEEDRTGLGLELTLGFELAASRANHVVPVKKRRIEFKNNNNNNGSSSLSSCKMELGLQRVVELSFN